MQLVDAEKLALHLMATNGVTSYTFKFDSAVRRFGYCSYKNKTISLSSKLVSLNDEPHVKDTILHEIAHALCGYEAGHGTVWREKAVALGCTGTRLYDSLVVKTPPKKYKGTCPNCKRVIKTNRRGVRSCGKCSPVYRPEYQFVWETL